MLFVITRLGDGATSDRVTEVHTPANADSHNRDILTAALADSVCRVHSCSRTLQLHFHVKAKTNWTKNAGEIAKRCKNMTHFRLPLFYIHTVSLLKGIYKYNFASSSVWV